jgi:hypothetical protein
MRRTEWYAMLRSHATRMAARGETEDIVCIATEEVYVSLSECLEHFRLSAFH